MSDYYLTYHCYSCNKDFDEPDIEEDYRGEFWGSPCYEMLLCCPYCSSYKIEIIEKVLDRCIGYR